MLTWLRNLGSAVVAVLVGLVLVALGYGLIMLLGVLSVILPALFLAGLVAAGIYSALTSRSRQVEKEPAAGNPPAAFSYRTAVTMFSINLHRKNARSRQ